MRQPLHRLSRRAALALAAAAGFHIANRADPTVARAEYPVEESLSWLPQIGDGLSVRVYRTTFAPGQSWDRRYLGKTSIMVDAGVMTVPLTTRKVMEIIMTSPTLGPPEMGIPSSHTSEYLPPNFTEYQGLIAEDGDFGVIENNGTDDLVVIVIETIPDLTS